MPRIVDHAERRRQVADVALDVIAELGLDSAGIRDVAAAGGWSMAAVTHYFADKDELLLHTLRRSAELATGRIALRVSGGEDPVRATVEEILPLDDLRFRQWQVWLAFWGRALVNPELAAEQQRRYQALRARLRVELDDAAVDALIARLDGVAIQVLFDRDAWPPARQLAAVFGTGAG